MFLSASEVAAERAGGRKADGKGEKSKRNGSAKTTKKLPKSQYRPKKIFRVTFHEITPKAIRAAFEHRRVNTNLVDAQQARRVLDRLVGYKISPLALGQSPARTFRRARADGGSAADRRARTGNPRVRSARILDHSRFARRLASRPLFEAKLSSAKGKKSKFRTRRRADKIVAAVSKAEMAGCERHTKRKEAISASAFHDLEAAAGLLQPAALLGKKYHDAGPTAL